MTQIRKGTPRSTQKRHAYNAGRFGYYQGTYPFINVCKNANMYLGNTCSGFTVTPGPQDADGWPTALAPGNSFVVNVCSGMDARFGYFPPGAYVIKSSSAATLQARNADGANSVGFSAHSDGVGSASFTATRVTGAWDTFSLYIVVTNNTAGTIAVSDLYCCLASEEASLLAGEIFKPEYLSFYTGARVIRYLDWLGMNAGFCDNVMSVGAMLNSENRIGYGGFADNGAPVPISICMKFSKKVGAETHVCVPTGFGPSYFYMDTTTNKVHHLNNDLATTVAHGFSNGFQVMISYTGGTGSDPLPAAAAPLVKETVYYVVNATSTEYQLSLTQGGAAIDFTNAGNVGPVENDFAVISACGGTGFDPYTNFYVPFAQACFAADPAATVHVEWTNEFWNIGPYKQANLTRFQASYWASGATGNVGAGAGLPILNLWKAFEAVYPAAQVKPLFANQAAFPGNSWSAVWDYVDAAGIYGTVGQTVAQIMNARPTRAMYAFAPYGYPEFDHLQYTGDATVVAIQPDVVYANNGNSFASISDDYWDFAANIILSEAQWQTEISVAYAKSKAPLIQCTTYEWGVAYGTSWILNTHTGGVATGVSWDAYMNGVKGLYLYQKLFYQTVLAHNLYCANQLLGPQGWRVSESGYDFFGITIPDPTRESARNVWFKTV